MRANFFEQKNLKKKLFLIGELKRKNGMSKHTFKKSGVALRGVSLTLHYNRRKFYYQPFISQV